MGLSDIFSSLKATSNQATSVPTGRVLGIDIGASSIKVVELQNREGILTLTTYGELELGPYADEGPVGQAVVLPANIERQALVDIIRESAVHAKQAVFSMPLASSFVTTMSLRATIDEDISPRVRVEARKYIPVPMADVTLDWAEIDLNTSNSDDEESTVERGVLLAAIQNDALTRFNGLLDTVGLPNTPVEIECFSTIRSLYKEDDETVIILDIGATSAKLYIVATGLLQRMYRVRAGGTLVTEKISKDLNISFDEAEIKKRNITIQDSDFVQIQKIHDSTYERVFREFKQVIAEYESKMNIHIDDIYLTGGGSLFPNFHLYVGNSFSKQVSYANAFNKVAYPSFMEDPLAQIAPTFTVAIGAALRSFE